MPVRVAGFTVFRASYQESMQYVKKDDLVIPPELLDQVLQDKSEGRHNPTPEKIKGRFNEKSLAVPRITGSINSYNLYTT